jgi:hypothetical protein
VRSDGVSAMSEAERLIDRLRSIGHLEFEATSAVASGWNGTGRGVVETEAFTPGVLLFRESGEWIPRGAARPIRFNNIYRWQRLDDDTLRLEHLRFGADRAVHLFDLACSTRAHWQSRSPHVCGDDRYSATLDLGDAALELRWSIVGPRKHEDIRYRYARSTESVSAG